MKIDEPTGVGHPKLVPGLLGQLDQVEFVSN